MSNENRYYENLCFRLKVQGLSVEEIVKETGMTKGQVVKHLDSYSKRNPIFKGSVKEAKVEQLTGDTHPLTITSGTIEANITTAKSLGLDFEDKLETVDDYFTLPDGRDSSLFLHKNTDSQRDKIASYIENKYKGKKVKILYMSDLHIPFTMYDLVKHIISEESDANILVVNGDLLDLFAVSTFAKDKTVALKRELQEGREFLEIVSKIFDDVVVTEGNHERRLRNYIKHVIPVDMHFLFPQDVLEVIQQGTVFKKEPLENVHVVGSWWIRLFDTIFGHPDNYSGVPMRTVIQTSEHFKMVKHVEHRACVIGHTHQAGWLVDRGTLVMETGCLNYDMDYKSGSKFNKLNWTRAYATFVIDEEGQNIFNDAKLKTFSV